MWVIGWGAIVDLHSQDDDDDPLGHTLVHCNLTVTSKRRMDKKRRDVLAADWLFHCLASDRIECLRPKRLRIYLPAAAAVALFVC